MCVTFIVAPTSTPTDETIPITQETNDVTVNSHDSSDKGEFVKSLFF